MTLPANIRVNVRVQFPALVQGGAFISVVKANGIWTLTPNYKLLALAPGQTPTQIIAVYDTANGVWNYVTAASLAGGGGGGGGVITYRTVAVAGAVAVLPNDVATILLQKSPSGASTINLPASSTRYANGLPITVKDLTYDANTNNITFVPSSGETLDGFSAAAAVANGVALINVDGGSKTFYPLTSGGWYSV